MTKDEFKDKIKTLVKQVYAKTEKSAKIDLDSPFAISLDNVRFPVLVKFPTLNDTIIKLLTDQYDLFIKDIEWVAPRPTTFRINLKNDQEFYLLYGKRSWIAQIEGKKYYLLNLPEEERAAEAISRILRYGSKEEASEENDGFTDFPEEKPAKETPPAEPETPETPEA
jgi:hypothetical protein